MDQEALTLEELVGMELKSNLSDMKVESKAAGKIGNALDRLRAMRGGGGGNKSKDKDKDKK